MTFLGERLHEQERTIEPADTLAALSALIVAMGHDEEDLDNLPLESGGLPRPLCGPKGLALRPILLDVQIPEDYRQITPLSDGRK
jgi:hypothetical protein